MLASYPGRTAPVKLFAVNSAPRPRWCCPRRDIRQLAHGNRIGGDILRRILTEERSGDYGSRDQGRKQLIHGAKVW